MSYIIPQKPVESYRHTFDKIEGKKAKVIQEIWHDPQQGYLVLYKGEKYPKKGWPDQVDILQIDLIKRFFRLSARFMSETPIRYFLILFLFLPKWIQNKAIAKFYEHFIVGYLGLIMQRIQQKDEYYCTSAREIRRTGYAISHEAKTQKEKEAVEFFADFFGNFMEFDNAWRYMVQDVLPEANVANIILNPAKELERLAKIHYERMGRTRDDAKVVARLLKLLFFFRPEVEKWIQRFFYEVNMEKVKLDDADWYHCLPRLDYNYRGMIYADRMVLRKQIDVQTN